MGEPKELDLDAIEARAEVSSAGLEVRLDQHDQINLYDADGLWICMLPHQCVRAIEEQQRRNADFFVVARERVLSLSAEVRGLREEQARWVAATGCLDPGTISAALGRIAAALERTPTEGIPDAIERWRRELTRAREEARLWRALYAAHRAYLAALPEGDHGNAECAWEAYQRARAAIRALGIDPDAPENT